MKNHVLGRGRRLPMVVLLGLWAALAGCRPAGSATDKEAALLTVSLTQTQEQLWPTYIQVNGAIKAWQEVIVSPEISALQVVQLAVEVGEQVKRGQLLVQLSDAALRAELSRAQASLAQTQAALEQAQANNRRAQLTAGSGALSEQQLDDYRMAEQSAQAAMLVAQAELENVQIKLGQTRISAADDGVVAVKSAVLGDVVGSGHELYRLIRQGRLEWQPEVDAKQLARLQLGDKASLTLPAGEVVEGSVRLIGPRLNDGTGRATVYVQLDEPNVARLGMFASGRIELGETRALSVPQSAITRRDGRAYVWLVNKDGRAVSQLVETGRQHGNQVEILSGLYVRQQVIESGGAFLSEGAKVAVSESHTLPAKADKS